MTDLRKAAEMALKYFEDAYGLEDTEVAIKEALRQALAQPEQGNSSPNYHITESNTPFVDAVNMNQERVDENGVIVHDNVPHSPDMDFAEEEKPQ